MQPTEPIEAWRKTWREGFAPILTESSLVTLANALASDDSRLIQGATSWPPPLMCVQDWDVEAACAVAYCGWIGEGYKTVSEVEEFFAKVCYEADKRIGTVAACRYFMNWLDEEPRGVVFPALLEEVCAELLRRGVQFQKVA